MCAGVCLRVMNLKDIWFIDAEQSTIKLAGFDQSLLCQSTIAVRKWNLDDAEEVAPELLRSLCTPATDIWNLGKVLYELVSGTSLYKGPHGKYCNCSGAGCWHSIAQTCH